MKYKKCDILDMEVLALKRISPKELLERIRGEEKYFF
jgi:hypothetical protein